MTIQDNRIIINNQEITIGMLFVHVTSALKDKIYISKQPGTEGRGYIIINDVDFYGLKGTCTILFQDGKVKQLGIEPDWGKYNLNDSEGKLMNIDEAVNKIAGICEKGLSSAFGNPVAESEYGNKVYSNNEFTITSTISRRGDQYSVIIL